jgi:formylglycine-generating enzyme required for sulfatase activity
MLHARSSGALALALLSSACATVAHTTSTEPKELVAGEVSAPAELPPEPATMARIPEATYRMGSDAGEPDERPVHVVHVAAFQMDVTEVTVQAYAACVRAGACRPAPTAIQFPGVTSADEREFADECNDDRADRQSHPVNCVDWASADAYCRWAGKRLPTEEEWEYAACGGDCTKEIGGRGGVAGLLHVERWPYTTRVAATSPGVFGLFDMAGNVWEWTASAYCPYDHPACGDARRVVRGGSWAMEDYLRVRLTDRSPEDPTNRNTNLGFRCAR